MVNIMSVSLPTILLLTVGLCAATYKICPAISVNGTQSVFGIVNYVQQGVWHHVPCPSFRHNETIVRVIWYKRERLTDRGKTLITYKSEPEEDYPESDRYAFGPSGFSLVIKGVQESDGGRYLCQVVPSDARVRNGDINIQVIGDTFPGDSSLATSAARFQRGGRQTLPCECASQTLDVVYWSTGEGVTAETQIIGARFSDGATLQIQHGADYNINSDASITVNSLNDVQYTERFWCHVFTSDGSLRNCDGRTSAYTIESARDALRASDRSFYLQKDIKQKLPCLSWTPGDTACGVEWRKLDNPDRQVLSYNLSTGVVDSSPEFYLASDFALVFQSVYYDHAGVYRCEVGDKTQIDVEVRVIGDHFPLDVVSGIGESVIFQPGDRFYVQCPALSANPLTTKAILFWSYGAPDAQTATVIGELNLVPDGSNMILNWDDKDCMELSTEGALILNNCSQDNDVRYWCHVFPVNDDLIRSYVDVSIDRDHFPLDVSSVIEGDCVTFKPKSKFYLECPALSDISLTTKATLFWSYGAPDTPTTTVIGELNLVPSGSKMIIDLGKNDCFDLSTEGTLILNNCSQDGDVRYWCHVYPANGDRIRSYVDVVIENSNCHPELSDIAIAAIVFGVVCTIIFLIGLIWKWRRKLANSREDRGRGGFVQVQQDPPLEPDAVALSAVKKTASENAESVGEETESKNAESLEKKTLSESAKSIVKETASDNAKSKGKKTLSGNAKSIASTASENAESMGKSMGRTHEKSMGKAKANENAESVGRKTVSENAESKGEMTATNNAESFGKKTLGLLNKTMPKSKWEKQREAKLENQ